MTNGGIAVPTIKDDENGGFPNHSLTKKKKENREMWKSPNKKKRYGKGEV